MQNVVNSFTGLSSVVQIEDVNLAEIHLLQDLTEVFPVAGRKIIDTPYFIAAVQQRAYQGRSNESGGAGHEIFSHASIIADHGRPAGPPLAMAVAGVMRWSDSGLDRYRNQR